MSKESFFSADNQNLIDVNAKKTFLKFDRKYGDTLHMQISEQIKTKKLLVLI